MVEKTEKQSEEPTTTLGGVTIGKTGVQEGTYKVSRGIFKVVDKTNSPEVYESEAKGRGKRDRKPQLAQLTKDERAVVEQANKEGKSITWNKGNGESFLFVPTKEQIEEAKKKKEAQNNQEESDKKGGGWWKWAAGILAVAALAIGGYFLLRKKKSKSKSDTSSEKKGETATQTTPAQDKTPEKVTENTNTPSAPSQEQTVTQTPSAPSQEQTVTNTPSAPSQGQTVPQTPTVDNAKPSFTQQGIGNLKGKGSNPQTPAAPSVEQPILPSADNAQSSFTVTPQGKGILQRKDASR